MDIITVALVLKSENYLYDIFISFTRTLYKNYVLFQSSTNGVQNHNTPCLIFDEAEGANDRNVDNCTSTGKMIGL